MFCDMLAQEVLHSGSLTSWENVLSCHPGKLNAKIYFTLADYTASGWSAFEDTVVPPFAVDSKVIYYFNIKNFKSFS